MKTKDMFIGQKVKSTQNFIVDFYKVLEIKRGGYVKVVDSSYGEEYTVRANLFVPYEEPIISTEEDYFNHIK